MKFSEAVNKLDDGYKITRQPWLGSVYFLFNGNSVKSYQPKLSTYVYNEDIMVSDGWEVEGLEGNNHKFYEIISELKMGKKARRATWEETFIYLDPSSKHLVVHSMEVFPYSIDFESFAAEDWVVVT